MLQAFYWDVPTGQQPGDGIWWTHLQEQTQVLSRASITAIWTPPPSKGAHGPNDMGYGVLDHYDLGNYLQRGTTETRFGSRSELESMIRMMHEHGIHVYADVVLNHMYAGDPELEDNPVLQSYIANDGIVKGKPGALYPVSEIVWAVPDASPGSYTIRVGGYRLPANEPDLAYQVVIIRRGKDPYENGKVTWETEPNDVEDRASTIPGFGTQARGRLASAGDIDSYRIDVDTRSTLDIRIKAIRFGKNNEAFDAPQNVGYRVLSVSRDKTAIPVHVQTRTSYRPVRHTGPNEPNYRWNYGHFHPSDANDDLMGEPPGDGVLPRWKAFGNDLATEHSVVKERLVDFGRWLATPVGFDGYRLDFVRGYSEEFAKTWIESMPLAPSGRRRFVVGEYYSGKKQAVSSWVRRVQDLNAKPPLRVSAFDFSLKYSLNDVANRSGNEFDMRQLHHAGLARDASGNSLPADSVVTFVENHDTGKDKHQWMTRDWAMAYAFILFMPERPCIFYPHLYGTSLKAPDASPLQIPAGLGGEIARLIAIRRNYLDGPVSILSEKGRPVPEEVTKNLFVARRSGPLHKSGAILVINNHDTETRSAWFDTSPSPEQTSLAGKCLVDITSERGNRTTCVQADGRVEVSSPPRGYAIWAPQSEWNPDSLRDARQAF